VPTADVGGLDLYYETRGAGPPLVLLNGLSQSTVNWMTQARHLSGAFTVITYDARGQGRSPVGPAPIDLDLHVRDLMAVLDELGVGRTHLAGFSYGGRLALAFAARAPHRVGKLVLTSTGDGSSAVRRAIVRSWYEVLKAGGMEAMAWAALPAILGEQFLSDHEDQLPAIIRAAAHRNSVDGLTALLEGHARLEPASEDARRVQAQTLVITSDSDPLVPLTSAFALTSAITNARHSLIPGCGHTIPIERPDLWRDAVQNFLEA
jgi:3-oxoadipate enol-lactonase